jgi:hypothetical protein
MARWAGWAVLAAASLSTTASSAQAVRQPFQNEFRLDAVLARSGALHAGYGVSFPAGIYVRSGVVAGLGIARHGLDGRADLISRFSLDPFRQSRWSPYAGGGLSGRFRSKIDGGAKAYLLVFLGLEGALPFGQSTGLVPAFELGLGGGTRLGVILRRGIAARR